MLIPGEQGLISALGFLFEDEVLGADSRALIYKLHTSENIRLINT
jgi:hypothetical protein